MHLLTLTTLNGVSGNENSIRDYIYMHIKDKCDSVTIDNIGNLIAFKKGKGDKKVMLCAHMDEIGLIASSVTDNGFIKFKTVGGFDPRILISKRVVIGDKKINGIIGYKAVHLQDKAERETAVKAKSLYIDIGAKNKKDAEKKVSLGDYIAFDSEYKEFGDNLIKAKALDDRAGCAILMYLLSEPIQYDFDLYVVFTVQEEVGLRGAKICAYSIAPDLAIVLESTTCSDVYGIEPQDYSTVLGGGVALSIIDGRTSYDKELTHFIHDLAIKNNVKVQYKKGATGGNDAGAIHLAHGGIKTAALSLPARYIHSPASVISKEDYKACEQLIRLFLKEAQPCLNY